MPYTGQPDAVLEDELRFLLGDTDAAHARMTDDEVSYLVNKYGPPAGGTIVKAAYQGALRLIAHFSNKTSKSVGPTSIQYGELVSFYQDLLRQLAMLGGRPTVTGAPTAGGLDSPAPLSNAEWEVAHF